ncbi:MAG: hypothetical protein JRG89_10320 [Deltaproteobacteria bacterium]|nr:hypothetical protein [Deltaproteobacteria bacterium]MBW2388820.1 hypothetical protein [Deltaproteobacteria bacterium]MBW2726275.1 hypothetical protein [Deltaproteobacteria bacterium]
MLNRIRRLTAAICVVALVAGVTLPSFVSADINSSDSEANNMTSPVMVDLLILRPAALVTLCVSTILFLVPVVPLTLLTRPSEIAKPFDIMVANPARFVWAHPLGSH